MNKKTIIQIVVIAFAFGMSGLVLYKGLFAGKPSSPTPAALTASQGNSGTQNQSILPYGKTLDFEKVLGRQNLQYGFSKYYPQLNANQEVGVQVEDLFGSSTSVPAVR